MSLRYTYPMSPRTYLMTQIDILENCLIAQPITKIRLNSHPSWQNFKKILHGLISCKALITTPPPPHDKRIKRLFQTTPKGQAIIETYHELRYLLNSPLPKDLYLKITGYWETDTE